MSEPSTDQGFTWYAQFDQSYGQDKRYEWYSNSSTAYRWARPRYPEAIIDRVIKQAHLQPRHSLMEVGCGPGIATEAFATKGLCIVAVEPSAAACELARKSCRDHKDVTVVNNTFEQYDLGQPAQQYDAVLAATSFHWITPEVACTKSATALKPGGSLILLWATPPQPNAEISDYLQPIYDRYELSELSIGQQRSRDYYQTNFEQFADTINQSGFFAPSKVEIETHHSTYSIEKYLALLSTLSPYIAIEETVRHNLLIALGEKLAEAQNTGALETTHHFASQVAPLKASA
ncbi:MAG: class I SAM-dependent methyltransferase [Phormidesmis sp.]